MYGKPIKEIIKIIKNFTKACKNTYKKKSLKGYIKSLKKGKFVNKKAHTNFGGKLKKKGQYSLKKTWANSVRLKYDML